MQRPHTDANGIDLASKDFIFLGKSAKAVHKLSRDDQMYHIVSILFPHKNLGLPRDHSLVRPAAMCLHDTMLFVKNVENAESHMDLICIC